MEYLPKDVTIYQINMTQIPEEERRELEKLIEKKLKSKLSKLKKDKKLNLRKISYTTNFRFGHKYRWVDEKNFFLEVRIKADCDDYKALTSELNKIFGGLSIFSDGLYPSHSIERYKDFETTSPRNRPVWL